MPVQSKSASQKNKPLSIRERKLIKALLEGNLPTNAMRLAGYKESTANKCQSSKIGETRIQEELQTLLERAGITGDFTALKVKSLMNAKKVVSCVSGKDAGAGSVDFVDVDDNQVQFNAAKLACQLLGFLVEKHDHTGNVNLEIISNIPREPNAEDNPS